MKETEIISPTPEQLLQLLDSQIAMRRAQNVTAKRNRAVFIVVSILVIVIGSLAAFLVLSQMVHDLPVAPTPAASSQGR